MRQFLSLLMGKDSRFIESLNCRISAPLTNSLGFRMLNKPVKAVFYDWLPLTQPNSPTLSWTELADIDYRQLNYWVEANKCVFISTAKNHVSSLFTPEPP